MAERQWYYCHDRCQSGPVDESGLQNRFATGQLPLDTPVWTETSAAWTPACNEPTFHGIAPLVMASGPSAAVTSPTVPRSPTLIPAAPVLTVTAVPTAGRPRPTPTRLPAVPVPPTVIVGSGGGSPPVAGLKHRLAHGKWWWIIGAAVVVTLVLKPEFGLLFWALPLVGAPLGVYLGWKEEAVFYYDRKDLALCFATYLVPLLVMMVGVAIGWGWMAWLAMLTSLCLWAYSAYLAWHHNQGRWLLVLPVALARTLIPLVYLFYFFKLLCPSGKTGGQRWRDRLWSIIVVGLLTTFLPRLINGQAVYALKGWSFQRPKFDPFNFSQWKL